MEIRKEKFKMKKRTKLKEKIIETFQKKKNKWLLLDYWIFECNLKIKSCNLTKSEFVAILREIKNIKHKTISIYGEKQRFYGWFK